MNRIAVCAAFLFAVSAHAQLPTPTLETVFPPGGQAGTETVVQLTGTDLDAVRSLAFAHPGIAAEPVLLPAGPFWPELRADGLKFRVRIGAEVPPGIYEVRAAGGDGLSTARMFAVSPAAAPAETLHPGAPHLTLTNPFPVQLEQTISGRLIAQQSHYHRIALQRGERVLIRVSSLALDSRADPRVAVFHPSGRELAAERGNGERDPVLDFRASEDGDSIVAVHDLLYRGGDAYPYRLVVSKAPPGDAVEPLAVAWSGLKPGHAVTERGASAAGGLPDRPVILEASVAQGQLPALPIEVSGRIDFPGNVDVYRFAAKGGETYEVEAISYRQGMDTDLALAVQRVAAGKDGQEKLEAVAESDDLFTQTALGIDTRIRDPGLTFKAAADGIYQVEIRNLGDDYGPAQSYRLQVGPATPKLLLFAAEERPHLTQNQAYPGAPVLAPGHRTAIRVVAVRSGGLTGPVRLSAKGLPEGVRMLSGVIWPQSSEGRIVLEAAPDAAPWAGRIEITGECAGASASALGATLKRGVADLTKEKASSRRSSGIPLAVCTADPPRLTIDVTADASQVELGKDLTFQVRVERKGAVKGAITVTPSGLPGFAKAPTLTITEKQTEGSLKVPFRPDNVNRPAEGTGTVVFQAAFTAPGFRSQPEMVAKLEGWKAFQDAAIAKLDPKDAGAQKAATAARSELDRLLAAARERAKERDLSFTVSSAPVEFTIIDSAKKKP